MNYSSPLQKLKSIFSSKRYKVKSSLMEPIGLSDRDVDITLPNSMRFTVTPARGGTVISVNQYDNKKDENITTLYVIPDDKDFKNEIANIMSLELLKRGSV